MEPRSYLYQIVLVLAVVTVAVPAWAGVGSVEILIIKDGSTEDDVATILAGAGMSTTITVYDYQWDGTNPAPDGFDAVVLLDGYSGWAEGMPASGQNALSDYVSSGGGLLITEWVAFEYNGGRYSSMGELIIIRRSGGATSTATYRVVREHEVTAGLPTEFTVPSHGSNVGSAVGAATVLITSPQMGDVVAIREYGDGGIVQFAMAGNYMDKNPWNLEMQQLLVNAVEWLAGPGRALKVEPLTGFASSGEEGGPFLPACITYTLTNTSVDALEWTATATEPWVDAAPGSGTLAGGASTTVDVCITANANVLPAGIYTDTVSFCDVTDGTTQTRAVRLKVGIKNVLAYTQYTDKSREYPNTLSAIDSVSTDYILDELNDYTQLGAMLPGHDVLLIPEQERASSSQLNSVGPRLGSYP